MASVKLDGDILTRLESLREDRGQVVDVSEIVDIVDRILLANGGEPEPNSDAGPPHGDGEDASTQLGMLQNLNLDAAISELFPAIAKELDAVVAATSESANGIMEAAESIGGVVAGLGKKKTQILNDAVTAIFEACSFQDITGQRIANVRTHFQNVEHNIQGVLAAMGDPEARRRFSERASEMNANAQSEDEKLLNGPQLEGEGISQEAIDKLLASFD